MGHEPRRIDPASLEVPADAADDRNRLANGRCGLDRGHRREVIRVPTLSGIIRQPPEVREAPFHAPFGRQTVSKIVEIMGPSRFYPVQDQRGLQCLLRGLLRLEGHNSRANMAATMRARSLEVSDGEAEPSNSREDVVTAHTR